jgi:D-alanyl-lipoteichoic acid acyltransferase DltB (MBOAT superfamily)
VNELMIIFPSWAVMWILAGSIYAACKVVTLCEVTGLSGVGRTLAYLFVWPGMNACEFFRSNETARRIRSGEWLLAIGKMILGAILLWFGVRSIPETHDLLRGWIGMIGLVLILHFGVFHLLALWFKSCGIDAEPLMNAPLKAQSVAEFWSRRWNVAFNQLAHRFIFRKIAPRFGLTTAVLATFVVSGLVHELVISVPAGGGYGFPTAYFVIQGASVLFEHSRFGAGIGLRRGLIGRAFTIVVTAAPAFWLFHPLFVRNVILPFLRTIGG